MYSGDASTKASACLNCSRSLIVAAFLSFSVSALKKGTSCRSAISNSIPSLGACDFINLRADLRGRGASTEVAAPDV